MLNTYKESKIMNVSNILCYMELSDLPVLTTINQFSFGEIELVM